MENHHVVYQWDIDTIDWKEERSAQTILDIVLPKLHDDCIILCRNNGFKIKEYLPTLIETAQSQGYEFVTVSELRLSGDTIIDVNGVQKAARSRFFQLNFALIMQFYTVYHNKNTSHFPRVRCVYF